MIVISLGRNTPHNTKMTWNCMLFRSIVCMCVKICTKEGLFIRDYSENHELNFQEFQNHMVFDSYERMSTNLFFGTTFNRSIKELEDLPKAPMLAYRSFLVWSKGKYRRRTGPNPDYIVFSLHKKLYFASLEWVEWFIVFTSAFVSSWSSTLSLSYFFNIKTQTTVVTKQGHRIQWNRTDITNLKCTAAGSIQSR